jgi:dTDP-4-dehydrorhamnose 3,5-epimerase
MARSDCLSGVTILTKDSFIDDRGELFTIWKDTDIPFMNFNHDKVATSNKNVLRGLHTDKSWKLITCLYGKIQLVIVNFDKESSEYLSWTDYVLDAESKEKLSILVPPGFLNGHLVLSDKAVFHYKWSYQGDYPDVKDQTSVKWSDPNIGIIWLIDNPILSERDKNTQLL